MGADEHGSANFKPQYVPDAMTFLVRHFGVRFWLDDPEGETVGIETHDISARDLGAVLEQYADAIKVRMHFDQNRRLSIFVGGPMNGKPHGRFGKGTTIAVHLGRAHWAGYQIGDDNHRAWFAGYATSEKKARILAYYGTKQNEPK